VSAEIYEYGDVLIKWNGCARSTDPARLVDGLAKAESDVSSRLNKAW
jgi:hypothetical protein